MAMPAPVMPVVVVPSEAAEDAANYSSEYAGYEPDGAAD